MKIASSSPLIQHLSKRRCKMKQNLKGIIEILKQKVKNCAKQKKKSRKKRMFKSLPIYIVEPNGSCTVSLPDPRQSFWYQYYIISPQLSGTGSKKFLRKFRYRFRLPYDKFLELFEQAKVESRFQR